MTTICVRFEDDFASDIEKVMKNHRYSTKTEFIREAVRDKIKDIEKQEALKRLDNIYGTSKKKTTDKKLKEAREKAFKDLAKKHNIELN